MTLPTPSPRRDRLERSPLVLVVADDAPALRPLLAALASAGFRVLPPESRGCVAEGRAIPDADLVLLDLAGAARDAVRITARLRERTAAPILVLSPRSREAEKVAVLDAGANDCIVKPFGTGELLARMRVWLRYVARGVRGRAGPPRREARVRVDREHRAVVVEGREIHLTPIELRVLSLLSARRGAAVPDHELIAALWGRGQDAARRAERLKLHIRQLRRKLEKNPADPRHLLAEPGAGYRLRLG